MHIMIMHYIYYILKISPSFRVTRGCCVLQITYFSDSETDEFAISDR